jgi:hypothetical protein
MIALSRGTGGFHQFSSHEQPARCFGHVSRISRGGREQDHLGDTVPHGAGLLEVVVSISVTGVSQGHAPLERFERPLIRRLGRGGAGRTY